MAKSAHRGFRGRAGLREPGFEDRDGAGGASEFGDWLGGVFKGMIWCRGGSRSKRRRIFMATKKEKIHKAAPAVDSMAGRAGETNPEEADETQELLDDPVFMKSHERAEKDRANGISRKFAEIRRL